jgi:hypothetical protein
VYTAAEQQQEVYTLTEQQQQQQQAQDLMVSPLPPSQQQLLLLLQNTGACPGMDLQRATLMRRLQNALRSTQSAAGQTAVAAAAAGANGVAY